VLHHHRVIHEAFEHAIKWGYLAKNPAQHATPPSVDAQEPEVLTEEETFTAIRAAQGTRFYLPILLAVFMGLRRGEVLGLRWAAIDWERKSLRVKEA
jgi:integrase